MIVPLYRELVLRGHSVVVLGFTMAQPVLQKHKIPYLSYSSFMTENDSDSVGLGESLVDNMDVNPKIPHGESVAYMGICFNELIEKHGHDQALVLYEQMGRQCFLPTGFMRRILYKIKPDLVITTNSPRSEQALVLESRKMGIRCEIINDFYGKEEAQDRMGCEGYGNRIFVAFSQTKKILLSLGRREDEVVVVGNPAFDRLSKLDVVALDKEFRKQHGLENKKIVVWAKSIHPKTQYAESLTESYLMEKYINNKSIQLVFRLHPNDPKEYVYPKNVLVSRPKDLIHPLLSSSNLILTVNSSVGLEGNLLGRAVAQIDLVDFPEKIPFSILKIGETFCSLDSLGSYIDKLLLCEDGVKRMQPCFMVGKITAKIVDYIEDGVDVP
jgi:hypothetical protein